VFRSDDYLLIRAGVDVTFSERWLVGAFYQYREDISNTPQFSYANTQIGVQVMWGF
jgi:hypothetical protein